LLRVAGRVATVRVSNVAQKIRAPGSVPKSVEILIKPLGINMVVIRLARGGSKHRPFFNVVVADKRSRRDGNFIERIGFYNPIASAGEEGLRIAADRITYWKSVGAQASPTVERLLKQTAAKAV
jgi:small subunit ribosomal protein S16